MYKKSILSVAIASSLMLTGCFDSSREDSDGANAGDLTAAPVTSATSRAFPVFSPAVGEFPKPNDLLIQRDNSATTEIEQSDGSYAIPGSDASDATPPIVALENLSGASITAPIDIEIGGSGSVDESTLDARSFIIAGSSVIPNPNQSVFLIELEYASGSPLTALAIKDKPTATNGILAAQAAGGDTAAGQALLSMATNPKYDAKVITLTKSDNTEATYIRINPLQPLNPNKRYVVVLTDDIKDTNGDSLVRNPGVASYAALSDPNIPLANPALGPVRELINDFWETVAAGYFAGLTNLARPAETKLDSDNIAFSMSLTTSNDTKVVDYMVEPNTWITDTLESKVKARAAATALAGGAADYSAVKTVVDNDYNNWVASTLAPTNATLTGALSANCPTSTYPVGAAQFACAGIVLEGVINTVGAGSGISLPSPKADTSITFSDQRDLRAVSAAITDSIATPGKVNVSEGLLTIPYYLEKPDTRGTIDPSIAKLVTGWWKADSGLATLIDSLLRNPETPTVPAVPQAITTGTNYVQSNIVNAFFPFPVNNGDVEIPILAIYPASDINKPDDGYKTIIYQHGITTDRSVALTLGSAIVANSGGTIAVIAIDQPLHGVDASSEGDKDYWAETFLTGGQSAGFPASLAPSSENNQALIDGTLATSFVTTSLNGAGIIDTSDGLSATESSLIAGAFDNTLATSVVTGQLYANAIIDISDGISAGEQDLIDSAFDETLASDVVTGQLHTFNIIDITDGIDAGEQATIDAVVAGTSGNPALAALEAAAASLTALEVAATTTLPSLQAAAQGLGLMQNTVANSASTIPGLPRDTNNERHFDFAGVNLQPVPIDFTNGTVGTSSNAALEQPNTGSGSLSINIGSFLTSRDNFRQQIVDLMTLRLSIPNMDLDGDGNPDLDTDNVHFIGHSLGTLNGIPFVEIANQTATDADNIKTANFLTPGGNIARLAENSEAFAPSILLGLNSVASLNRGDADLETFLNVFQIAFDSFDPINFAGNLSTTTSTTKALFTEVVGDSTIPNAADPAVDIVQPDRLILLTVNDDYSISTTKMDNPYAGISFGPGTKAPLAGTSPLEKASGATAIDSSSALGINFLRFAADSGATHGSPVVGTPAVFGQIVESALSMVATDGTSVAVSNTALIKATD